MTSDRPHSPRIPAAELRKNDALVRRIREIRKAHHITQAQLVACMNVAEQAIKKIESGEQQLPGVQEGSGPSLHTWLEAWFRCVAVSDTERREIEDLLMLKIIGRIERGQSEQ
jgi:transcriptional regulator with XRE-family HTH domain